MPPRLALALALVALAGCASTALDRDARGFYSRLQEYEGMCGERAAYAGPSWISVRACARNGAAPGAPSADPNASWLTARFDAPDSPFANPGVWRMRVVSPTGETITEGLLTGTPTHAKSGRAGFVSYVQVPPWTRGVYRVRFTSTLDPLRDAEIKFTVY